VTAVTLSLSLAFERAESNIMQRPPRSTSAPLLDRFLMWRILFVSILMVVGTLGFFMWEQSLGASIDAARTAAVNTLVVCEIFYLINCRFLLSSAFGLRSFIDSRPVLIAIASVTALQLLFTYAPPFQRLFGTVALDISVWWRIFLFGVLLFAIVEAEKMLLRNRQGEHPAL